MLQSIISGAGNSIYYNYKQLTLNLIVSNIKIIINITKYTNNDTLKQSVIWK